MNTKKLYIENVWSRPGLYLAHYDQIIDASSFLTNFLDGVLCDLGSGPPNYIDISVSGQYFSITASGCSIAVIDQNPELLEEIFDPPSDIGANIDGMYGFTSLKPIIWFSEFCIIDISNSHNTFRQTYLNGEKITNTIKISLNSTAPIIGFVFTLSSTRFSNITLDMPRFRHVFQQWKKIHQMRVSRGYTAFRFETSWKSQSDHHFIVRITPKKMG